MVLVAVEVVEVNLAAVGAPGDTAIVLVGIVARFEPHGFLAAHIEYADADLVAGRACHGVLDRLRFRYAVADVNEGIIGHHALVHAVEAEPLAVGAPEGAF